MSDELILSDRRAEKDAQRNDRAMHARGSCDQCRFCGALIGAAKEVTFVCRFKPPAVTAVAVQQPNGQMGWLAASSWPNVTKNDWCGEFAPVQH